MKYHHQLNLENHCISVGPFTILTVDEGYAAITQNNGKQEILQGGRTHLLSHKKWKFEKFITLKIQTDELEKIQAASADNIIMSVSSTVVWRIKDVHTAAMMGADTMASSGIETEVSADISKLRRDVLKQAIASLASFIGSVNYSDSFHIAAAAQREGQPTEVEGSEEPVATVAEFEDVSSNSSGSAQHARKAENPMFDSNGMSDAVKHANRITSIYWVEITSINIISANPVNQVLTASLASGAVAAAEALQAETAARGQAKALKIEAEAQAEKEIVVAKAQAESKLIEASAFAKAEKKKAEGKKEAADLLSQNEVAVQLSKMALSSSALKSTDKFFFSEQPEYMKNVIMPMKVVVGDA